MLARLFCLLVLLALSGVARAQEPWTPAGPCVARNWNEIEAWRDWLTHARPDNDREWAEERSRWINNRDVWRWLDRLYIAIDGGEVLTLADCPFSEDMHRYLYEAYDETGGFHIVAVRLYEDMVYALVMRRSGRVFTVPGLPVWSPDRTRFASGACSVLNDQDGIAISRVTPEGLKTEAEGRMPCGLGDCRITWENDDSVA
ncbi:MAG: hypothetical protein M3Y43_09555, partial [Pseudomonadota bacterium]|nr:hypothetical protein [Pseudomonadota bacterium]